MAKSTWMKSGCAPSFGVLKAAGMARAEATLYSGAQSWQMISPADLRISASRTPGKKTGVSQGRNSIFVSTAASSACRNLLRFASVKLLLNRKRNSGITFLSDLLLPKIVGSGQWVVDSFGDFTVHYPLPTAHYFRNGDHSRCQDLRPVKPPAAFYRLRPWFESSICAGGCRR